MKSEDYTQTRTHTFRLGKEVVFEDMLISTITPPANILLEVSALVYTTVSNILTNMFLNTCSFPSQDVACVVSIFRLFIWESRGAFLNNYGLKIVIIYGILEIPCMFYTSVITVNAAPYLVVINAHIAIY